MVVYVDGEPYPLSLYLLAVWEEMPRAILRILS